VPNKPCAAGFANTELGCHNYVLINLIRVQGEKPTKKSSKEKPILLANFSTNVANCVPKNLLINRLIKFEFRSRIFLKLECQIHKVDTCKSLRTLLRKLTAKNTTKLENSYKSLRFLHISVTIYMFRLYVLIVHFLGY